MNRPVARGEDWSDLTVECTQCGVSMTAQMQSGSKVRYFRCGKCHRWVSSTYAEVLRADAKFKATRPTETRDDGGQFAQIKDRLERWLAALDEQDPYRVLGVSPHDPTERVRSKYRELALNTHPDRPGGSAERMRQLNLAYERVLDHRSRTEAGSVFRRPALATAASPARSR